MDGFTLLAITCLLGLALFAWKDLYYFNYSNGLMEFLTTAVVAGRAPSGRTLKALSTNGFSQWIDVRLPGSCVFQLLLFEDWSHPDTACAGAYFTGSFCACWALVVLESLRAYNMDTFGIGSWTTIPGLLMFNYTPAIMLPLYLAVRLALITPTKVAPDSLIIDAVQLSILPWAFLTGYIIPFVLMLLPDFEFRGLSSKHTLAAWWQQWPAYVTVSHILLWLFWPSRDSRISTTSARVESLRQLETVYVFIFAIAAFSHWFPILACLVKGVSMCKLFIPSAPRKDVRAHHGWEASKWTVQWDVIMGTPAMLLWTGVLYWQTHLTLDTAVLLRTLWCGFLGGPLGAATVLLWERDRSILSV